MAFAAGGGDVRLIYRAFRLIRWLEVVTAVTIDTGGSFHVAIDHQGAAVNGILVRFNGRRSRQIWNLPGQLLIFMAGDAKLNRIVMIGAGVRIADRENIVATVTADAGRQLLDVSLSPQHVRRLAETFGLGIVAFPTEHRAVARVRYFGVDTVAISAGE